MSTKRIVLSLLASVVLVINLQSCYKVTTFMDETGTLVTGDVSYTKDIAPILNNSCAVSGCHTTGGLKPDLSENNSYNSLNNGGYFNVNIPENSEVYLWLTGKKSATMPPNGPVNPSNVNQLILAWVKQGASNN
jgi:hypothetical protein